MLYGYKGKHMIISQTLLRQVNKGDILDDDDLETAINFYENLHEALRCLGPVFELAANDICCTWRTLQRYRRERELEKTEHRLKARFLAHIKGEKNVQQA
jgi:hypothetical protein